MRVPEVVEALRIRLKKFAQLEVGRVRAVPLQQLLELRVPGERSHGGTREVHGAGRARKRKERGAAARSKSVPVRAAAFMAQASGPAPPGPASGPRLRPRPASVLGVR